MDWSHDWKMSSSKLAYTHLAVHKECAVVLSRGSSTMDQRSINFPSVYTFIIRTWCTTKYVLILPVCFGITDKSYVLVMENSKLKTFRGGGSFFLCQIFFRRRSKKTRILFIWVGAAQKKIVQRFLPSYVLPLLRSRHKRNYSLFNWGVLRYEQLQV